LHLVWDVKRPSPSALQQKSMSPSARLPAAS
jgi:hypothetical protein